MKNKDIEDILNNLESNIYRSDLTLNNLELLLKTISAIGEKIEIECTDNKPEYLKRLNILYVDFKEKRSEKKETQQLDDKVNSENGLPTSKDTLEDINKWSKGLFKDHSLTKFSPNQLDFIFDEMVNLEHFVKPQKKQFIYTFQGKIPAGTKLLKWKGDKSLIRYFMKRMTDRDIKPKEIKGYITPPIESNDNCGEDQGGNLAIKKMFGKVTE